MKNKKVLFFPLLLILLGGCIKVTTRTITKTEDPADQKQAKNVAESFYTALINKNYDQTYTLFGTPFYKVASKEALHKDYEKVATEFGPVKKVALISSHTKTIKGNKNSGNYVLIYAVRRSISDTYETFTMDLEGNKVKIINYDVKFIR